MARGTQNQGESATIRLRVVDETLTVSATLPAKPAGPESVLPFARDLSDRVLAGAERRSAAAEKPISCSKGCDACCRHLVPLNDTEARALWATRKRWPGSRRGEWLQTLLATLQGPRN